MSLLEIKYDALLEILRENIRKFAWSYHDMSGLNLGLVVHYIIVDPKVNLVNKNLSKMHRKESLLVKADLKKLLQEKII